MIRAIPVLDDVPQNYVEIIVVFAEANSTRGKTGTMMNFAPSMIETLKALPLAKRYRLIKEICSAIQDNLLQSSKAPGDVMLSVIPNKAD